MRATRELWIEKLIIVAALLFALSVINGAGVMAGLGDTNDTSQAACVAYTHNNLAWMDPNSNPSFWTDGSPVDGTYNPMCCGDDIAGENYRSLECYLSGQAAQRASYCTNTINVNNCCNNADDCVHSYTCFAEGQAHELSTGVAYCLDHLWRDCDESVGTCTTCDSEANFPCSGAGCYVVGGEVVGEYTPTDQAASPLQAECCGDDNSEIVRSNQYGASLDFGGSPPAAQNVCCSAATDCVHNGACYAHGASFSLGDDGDSDYCLNGGWVDCGSNTNCDTANQMGCVQNNCVDVVPPIAPYTNFTLISGRLSVYGYINESGNVHVQTRKVDQGSAYWSYQMTDSGGLSSVYTVNNAYARCKSNAAYTAGTTGIFLKECTAALNPATTYSLKFVGHNTSTYRYYVAGTPTAVGQQYGFNLVNPNALRRNVAINEVVYVYTDHNPSGYFDLSSHISPLPAFATVFQEGNNYIYVWGEDLTGNNGPTRMLGPVSCDATRANCRLGCGFNAGENLLSFKSGIPGVDSNPADEGCCNSATACVYGGTCSADGSNTVNVDADADTDYCVAGTWYDCKDNTNCPSGFSCTQARLCVDTGIPAKPTANFTIGSNSINVLGHIGEPIDVQISLRQDGQSTYYHAVPTIQADPYTSFIGTCKASAAYSIGEYDIFLKQCSAIPTDAHFIKFKNHNKSDFRHYDISSIAQFGQEYGLTLSEGIVRPVVLDEDVYVYGDVEPSGYFTTTIARSDFVAGRTYIYVWGEDYANPSNVGPALILGPIQCTAGGDCTIVPPLDSTPPIAPTLWTVPSEVNSSVLNVIGHVNESINVTVRLISTANSLSYFERTRRSGAVSQRLVSCTVSGNYNTGATSLDLSCPSTTSVVKGRFVQFGTHNGMYFRRYNITSSEAFSGNLVGVQLSRGLESPVSNGAAVQIHTLEYPSGWFNISVNLNEGNTTIRVWGIDDQGNAGNYFQAGPVFFETPTSLQIWDSTRYTVAAYVNDTVTFFANYTNSTDGFITGAACRIGFSDRIASAMTESSGRYQFSREFNRTGTFSYNVNCTVNSIQKNSAQSSITIYQNLEIPLIWELPSAVNTSSVRVVGYSNSSLVTVNVYTLGDPADIDKMYVSEVRQFGNISSMFSALSAGISRVYVPQADYNRGYFTVGRYIEFAGHDQRFFRRYEITGVEDLASPLYAAVDIDPPLEAGVALGERITAYDQALPLGWFNLSLDLLPGENYISAYNNKTSFGPSTEPVLVYYDVEEPSLLFPMNSSSANTFTYQFVAVDDFGVDIVNLSIDGQDVSISCIGSPATRLCSVQLTLSDAVHLFEFLVKDQVGNTLSFTKEFVVDTTISDLTWVEDDGDITTSKTLSATWSAYADALSSALYYQYSVGTAPHPSAGWSNMHGPVNTTSTSATVGPLNLIHGVVYYFNVRAMTDVGQFTDYITSDGIVYIDETVPSTPVVVDDGFFTSSNSELHATWNSTDPEAGISGFDVSIGTKPYPQLGWNTIHNEALGPVTEKTFSVSLLQNQTYYITARARNSWGGYSQRGSSNGIKVDITPPAGGSINYSLGGATSNQVNIRFSQGYDYESGIKTSKIYLAKLAYLNGQCSGIYLYDQLLADVTGLSQYTTTISNGYCYKFKLTVENNASLKTEYYYYGDVFNKTLNVDTTPPELFSVFDDGAITYDGTKLHAYWTPSVDNESGVTGYSYRIRYSVNNGNLQDLIGWTSVGLQREVTRLLPLNHSTSIHQLKYYFDVKARNGVGLNTTRSSNGIIYIDTIKPTTSIHSIGPDRTYPYSVVSFGNTTINVTGEDQMHCVFSRYDIDYSDDEPPCVTYGSVASCIVNLTHGQNTYHIICEDKNGNGQDFDENIDITFNAFVLEPVTQVVNIDSAEPLTARYVNTSGYLFAQRTSDTVISSTVFKPYLYNVEIYNKNGTFAAVVKGMNISKNPVMDVKGRYMDVSLIYDNDTKVGNSSMRYRVRAAYAFELNGTREVAYDVRFNYTSLGVSNENALEIFRFAYDFDAEEIDYSYYTHYSATTRDTERNIVAQAVSGFSVFVLVEDTQEEEACGDSIDNNGDGLVDEGCRRPGGGGGSGNKGSSGGGGSGPIIKPAPTCKDGKRNQNETDIDCGGNKCDPCQKHKTCKTDLDCVTDFCNPVNLTCQTPSCFDGIRNQYEQEVDCGGPCKPCGTCSDKIENQDETDVDCGGSCGPCATCSDGVKNQGEDDVDCGGPCLKACATCYDFKKNGGETGVDCGGRCPPCEDDAELETPGETGIPVLGLIFGFFILTGLAVLVIMMIQSKNRHHEEPAMPIAKEPEPIAPTPIVEKHEEPIIEAPPITDDTIMQLQRYVNYSIASGRTKGEVYDRLKSLNWDESIIDELIRDCGDYNVMRDVMSLEEYAGRMVSLGIKPEELEKEIKKNSWDRKIIDAVLDNVGIVSDQAHLKKYIAEELRKGREQKDIELILSMIGWPKKITRRVLIDCQNNFKTDKEELQKAIREMVRTGMSPEDISLKLEDMGYEKGYVKILLDDYSVSKNVKIIKDFVNMELKKGFMIGDIIDSLIDKGWAIDLINQVVSDNMLVKDLPALIDLEKYIEKNLARGVTKDMIKKDLDSKKWADEYIDIVLLKVHVIDDKLDKIRKFMEVRQKKGDAREKIVDTLVRLGWSRRIVLKVLGFKREGSETGKSKR